MHFSRQSRPITQAYDEGVDLELRAPRVRITLRLERMEWFVQLWWLTDRRRWAMAYEWRVWGREDGVALVEYLELRFGRWEPGRKGPSPIPGWLKECAMTNMPVSPERIRRVFRKEAQ